MKVDDRPYASWLGTGVPVDPGVILTNRHVALRKAEESAEGGTWAPIPEDRRPDRLPRGGGVAFSEDFALVDVLSVEPAGDPTSPSFTWKRPRDLPQPIGLGAPQAHEDAVAAIGYTGRETGLPPEVERLLEIIFGTL
jgi:hypothetical protein